MMNARQELLAVLSQPAIPKDAKLTPTIQRKSGINPASLVLALAVIALILNLVAGG